MDTPGEMPRLNAGNPVQAGTLSAVYEFLERVAGVRWYGDDDIYQIGQNTTGSSCRRSM